MVKDKLPLTTLCLITTHKCTSACPNCGFFCSPKQNNSMTIDSMLHYIDKSKTMFPSIYCLVLTGGEISCYKNEDIAKVITFAKSKGIINTRIVSNAAWAKNLEAAKKYLLPLIQAGLTELNISTGDEHSMFVPINNVLNAIKAAYDNGANVLQAVENGDILSLDLQKIGGDEIINKKIDDTILKSLVLQGETHSKIETVQNIAKATYYEFK